MAKAPKTLNHPTFGQCELIPSLVAIKWTAPLDGKTVVSALSRFGLSLAHEAPRADRRKAGASRDPIQPSVNQTTTLSWAKGSRLTEATLSRIEENDDVEWVAPTYRATRSDKGPQSYFAINPTCLLLTAAAAAAVGDVASIDLSASVDDRRSHLLKGFVVLNLPNGNAIELAAKIGKSVEAGGILFENFPYLSPICACSCGGLHPKEAGALDCLPSTTSHIPNDTFFPVQWGLQQINAPRAWPLSEGDPNIVIAVLDQGVELGHPDLNMWPLSYSTVTHTNDGSPVGNHGTPCAGIIGARIDNSTGVSGLAGKCRIMAIATNFADTQVAEGLYFAADNGARVISMSFGVYPSWMIWNFAIIEAALQYCQEKNVVLVAATGNEDQNVSRFPATDPRTIGVGGSNRDDVRKAIGDTSIENWWGACYGPDVDVVAPCLEIPTTDRLAGAGYTLTDYDMRFNGTSSATPHVAGLAGLIFSVNPALTNAEVRQIISQTTDKINVAGYTYLATAGKPYGTWNDQVGYGRINAERAVLVACSFGSRSKGRGPCDVDVPTPEECCVSPCDPPWRPDQQCIVWYEERFLRQPIAQRDDTPADFARSIYIEFRITYEHKLCLLGKQHGPLIYTVTLLPSEKLTLYHSDRYRRITSTQDRFSVQTTFMQFFSSIQQARVTNTVDALSERLSSVKTSASGSFGGGLGGLLGLPSGSASVSASVTDHNLVRVGFVSDQFNQTIVQASQLTHAERSIVVSTFEEKETADISARTIQNDNACRAVTYFVRRVVELYAFSTRVSGLAYRIIAPNIPPDWHSLNDIAWLPARIQQQIKAMTPLLPKVGDITEQPKPISLPTDGTVYNPELANCCSCEPERAAAIDIQLEKQKAEALKLCLDAELLQLEVERRRLLLKKGELAPFDPVATPPAVPVEA
jgi:Subtilase family